MKVITIAAAKGGSTKSTVTLSLAVRASQESVRVAMFDLNADQGDLTKWWKLRGEPMCPRLIDVDKISQDVEVLRNEGFEWLLIDTPPLDLDVIENAILKSDAVVIPVRTGFFDVDSVTPVVEMCRERRRPYGFLLSAVDSKMPRLIDGAKAALVGEGPIFKARFRYLQSYIQSLVKGRSAAEIDKSCQAEVDELWDELKRLVSAPIVLPVARRDAS